MSENKNPSSYIRNCIIIPRENSEVPLFSGKLEDNGKYLKAEGFFLDGYVIMPIEKYRELCGETIKTIH